MLKEPRKITVMKQQICAAMDETAKIEKQKTMDWIDSGVRLKLTQMRYRLKKRYGTTDGWIAVLTKSGKFKAVPKKGVV